MRVLTEAGVGAPGVSVVELLSQPAQRGSRGLAWVC